MKRVVGHYGLGILLVGLMFSMGCPTDTPHFKSKTKTRPIINKHVFADAPVEIEDILKRPNLYQGKFVFIRGKFMGWKGKCKGKPPISRSDWMIESKNACLYVTGKLPPNLRPTPPSKDIGKPVTIRGTIHLDQNDVPYLSTQP